MKFIIFVKATPMTEVGGVPGDVEAMFKAMEAYNQELANAGVLLDLAGLQPSSKGFRIRYEGGERRVIDGPFTEAKELVAGYTLIDVRSRSEAVEWARRFPNPMGEGNEAEIEVRPLYSPEDVEELVAKGKVQS